MLFRAPDAFYQVHLTKFTGNVQTIVPTHHILQCSGQVVLGSDPRWFAPGGVDVFQLELPHMGMLDRLLIGHDGRGSRPRWCLESVTIRNVTDDAPPALFRCGASDADGAARNATLGLIEQPV